MLITWLQRERLAGWRLVRPLLFVFCLAAPGLSAAQDVTPPLAGITQPVDGSFQSSLPAISGTAFDSVAVASVTLSIRRNSDLLYWDGVVWTAAPAWLNASVSSLTWSYSSVPAWVGGSTYTINARAMDTSGNWSLAYATGTFVYGVADTPPGALTDLAAAPGAGVGSLLLSWSVPGADGASGTLGAGSLFYVQYSTYSGAAWSAAAAQVALSTSGVAPATLARHYIGALDPGTTYYLAVWHKDPADNYSAVSNIASAYAKPFPGVAVTRTVNGDGTWQVTFPISPNLTAPKIAGDAAGNIYYTGTIESGSNTDVLLYKFDPAGNLLLAKYFNGADNLSDAGPSHVAVDPASGAIYLALNEKNPVMSGSMNLLIKYDANGQMVWQRRSNGTSPTNGQGLYTTTTDPAGNVYIGGSISIGADRDSWIRKYTSSGDVVWTATKAYSGNYEGVLDLAASGGYLYAAGTADMSSLGQGQNATLWKLDINTGLTQWTTYYTGAANKHDDYQAIIADASGYVYLAGDEQAALNDYAQLTQKRDPAGAIVWKDLLNYSAGSGMHDQYQGIALGADGSLYEAGLASVTAQGYNAILAKRAADGTLLGQYVYDLAGANDAAYDLLVSSDKALLAGYETLGGQPRHFLKQVKLSDIVPVDSTAPAAVADLAAAPVSAGAAALAWTAPGDDGMAGALTGAFLIQYATHTGVAWSTAAAQVTVSTSGVTPGTARGWQVGGLLANTTYYFKLWSRDEAGNTSIASNNPAAATLMNAPSGIVFEDISSTSLTASAYLAAMPGLSAGLSGVNIAKDGAYSSWRNGNLWAAKAAMPTTRDSFEIAAVGGKLYAIGGETGGATFFSANEEYDPAINAWTTKAAMPTARFDIGIGAINGRIYVVGGSTFTLLRITEEYDPATNSWATKAPMSLARYQMTAKTVGNKLYVLGGHNGFTAVGTNEVYDPASNTWSIKAPLPTARYQLLSAVVNDKLYAIGGIIGNASATVNTNEEYDPLLDTWTTKAPLPTTRYSFAAGVIGGKIYAAGGYALLTGGGPHLNVNEEYDPTTNAWTTRAPIPTARREAAAGVVKGRMYVIGGYNGVSKNTNEEYDPGTAFAFSGLTPNTHYTFTAKARNLNGIETAESPSFSAWTLPNSPANLTVSLFLTSSTLSWGLNGNPAGTLAQVYRSTDNASFSLLISTPALSFSDSSLQFDATNYYRVLYLNGSGAQGSYAAASAYAPSPYSISSAPFSGISTSSLTVNWTSNYPGGTVYYVRLSSMPAAGTFLYSSTTTASTHTFSGLAANTGYYGYVSISSGSGFMQSGSGATLAETPVGIYFDEVNSTFITASAYLAALPGLSAGQSGTSIAKNGVYSSWRNGDIWTTKAVMPTTRDGLEVVVVGGKIYAIGGEVGGTTYFSANEEYDPAANTWTTKATMPTSRFDVSADAINGRIYAVGGSTATLLKINEEYDPASNSWATKTPMSLSRYQMTAKAIGNKLYVIGGHNGLTAVGTNEEYDPASDTWSLKAALPTARYQLLSAVVNGKLYTIGGIIGNVSAVVDINEEYDPVLNVWTTKAPLPTTRYAFTTGVIGGKIYAAGGYALLTGGGPHLNVNEEYDPATDTWATKAVLPTARREAAAGVVNGKMYVIGGYNGTPKNTNEEYDPGVSHVFSGLTPSTQYTFAAKARNLNGIETVDGPQVSTWTLANPPAGLAGAAHISSATLTWGLNGNPAGTLAQVYRSTDNVAFSLVLSTPALSYFDTGLQPAATYFYRVRNVNGAGVPTAYAAAAYRTSAPPAVVIIDTPATELGIYKPGAVLNIKGQNGENLRQNESVKISLKRLKEPVAWWHEPSQSWVALDTYTFVNQSGGAWVQSISGPVAFTEGFSSYTVTATGYNTDGIPQAEPATRTFFVDNTMPSAAVLLPAPGTVSTSFSGISGTAADPSTAIVSVNVKVLRLSDGYSWNGVAWSSAAAWNLAAGTTSWLYTGLSGDELTSGSTYFASARATDAAGNTQLSEILGSTFTYIIPLITPQPFSGVSASSLTVNWGSSFSSGTVYSAILSTMPAPVPVFGATTTALSHTFTGLVPNTGYYGYVSTSPGSGYLQVDARATLAVPPTSPAFSEVYYSSFVFSWSAGQNSSDTAYEYEVSQSSWFASSFSGFGPGLAMALFNRAEGSTWYARVRAINVDMVPTAYVYAGPITTLIAPASGTVAGLAGTALGTSSVAWHWNAGSVAQAAGYGVFAASGGALGTVAFSTAGSVYVQGGLSPNMPVAVRVGAYTGGGYGPLTQSATYFTLAAAPVALAVTGRSDAQVSLDWAAGGNPAGTLYQLLRSTSADFTPAALATTTALSHAAAGLNPGTAYYFKLRALNGDGLPTAYGAAVSTSTLPPLPARPAAPGGAALGVSSISWTWAAVGGAAGYVVRPATAPASSLASPAAPAFVQAGLLPNTTYSLAVAALNDSGEGPLSPAAAPVSTLANPPAALSAAVFATSATLTWGLNGNPAGTSARVLRAGGVAGVTSGLVFTDTRLLGCTTYYFGVWNVNRDGLPTAAAETGPLFTAAPAPLPPGNLSAQPLSGGRIFLSWEPAPFEGVTGYNLYSDNGTGTIDYNTAIVVMTAQQTSYTTPVLAYGTVYKYGLRAVHRCGLEEKNTYVRASAAALASLTGVRAAIKVPQTGKKVSGNSVTVMAELITGTPAETLHVRFQYRAAGAGAWLDIPAKDPAAHPNPDPGSPYFIHWNVTGLTPGAYELRAVATDLAYVPDSTPAAIMITVDPAEADIVENASGGKVTKSQTVNNLVTNTLQAADSGSAVVTRLEIPAGALDNSTATVALTNNPAVAPPPPADAEPVGVVAEVVLSNQSVLAGGQTAAVTLPYPDSDGDGVVDGTTMHANQLVMYSAHNAAGPWQRDLSSVVDVANRKVTGYTTHFSFFALFAPLAADLRSARAYPVPWKPGSGGRFDSAPGTDGIIIDNLTDSSEIRIFNVAGQLVREYKLTAADLGFKVWDGRNSAGQKAGSGVYLVHIKSGAKIKVLKIAVER